MPVNLLLPSGKPVRVAHNNSQAVGANSDSPKVTAFTVPNGRKYTVLWVGTDQSSTTVDLLALHIQGGQAVVMVDATCSRLPSDQKVVLQWETFSAGESMAIGIRNGTGAPITPQLEWAYIDEPA